MMQISSQSSFLALILGLLLCSTVSANVVTCGGVVTTASNLEQDVDYSSIKVHLFTASGLLKYTGECSAAGDYFIPVYDKGSFYLEIEGSPGWAFDPQRHHFEVTDTHQGCSEDVNFVFSGFAMKGFVKGAQGDQCAPDVKGPSGVMISISSANEEIATIESTDGRFSLSNLLPGTYTVVASHPRWTIVNPSQTLSIGMGNSQLNAPFIVSGFSLSGDVMASAGNGLEGVDMLLYTATKPARAFSCPQPHTDVELPDDVNGHLVCGIATDDDGKFTLDNLPCGQYTLVPHHKRSTTSFDVSPFTLPVTIGQSDVSVAGKFQVMGFSMRGRVVDTTGKGIPGVVVSLNGEERATTDAHGQYKADKMSSGAYDITAAKDHYVFASVPNVPSDPLNPTFPDVVVSAFHLCGSVELVKPSSGGRSLSLVGTGDSAGVSMTATTGPDNRFCFTVAQGTYEVTPSLSYAETSSGVVLAPPSASITVQNRPVLNLDFSEARVKISGSVRCLTTPCSEPIKVSLTSDAVGTRYVTVDANDNFVFPDISPSTYQVKLEHNSWCWEQDSIEVSMGHSSVGAIEFVQNGYILRTSLSHDVSLNIRLAEGQGVDFDKTFDLSMGSNNFCLIEAGVYTLTPESCHRFEQETYSYDTAHPSLLQLTVSQLLATGEVLVSPAEEFKGLDVVPVTLIVGSNTDPIFRDATYTTTETREVDGSSNIVRVYTYSYWATPNSRVQIQLPSNPPSSPSGSPLLDSLLFYPSQASATISSSCPASLPEFAARPGLFLRGQISPAIQGAEVMVTDKETGQVVLVAHSAQDGSYEAGPLYDEKEYDIEVQADNYQFSRSPNSKDGTVNFKALQLGRISVRVTVQGGEILAGLPEVYLSLSGKGFRVSNKTDHNGEFDFKRLQHGKYTLRPLLKEYEFDPPSLVVNVEESTHTQLAIQASRAAFSAYGSLRSLSSDPEKGASIEAIEIVDVDANGQRLRPARSEEAITDNQGNFRIQGLLPGASYSISLKSDKDQIVTRTYPEAHKLVVSRQDTFGIDFVAFRPTTKFDVTGTVDVSLPDVVKAAGAAWTLTPLHVDISVKGAHKPLHSLALSDSVHFFTFPPLPQGDYTVQVRSASSPRAFDIKAPVIDFHLDRHTHLTPSFQAALIHVTTELDTHAMFPICIAFFCWCFAYRDFVLAQLLQLRKWHNSRHQVSEPTSTKQRHTRKKRRNQ